MGNISVDTFILIIIVSTHGVLSDVEVDEDEPMSLADFGDEQFTMEERHYLLYDVNPGEGFNLRRDVYMRVANSVRQLRDKGHNYVLVLPPWGDLYHWYLRGEEDMRLPWGRFFDLKSLSSFVPIMEFDEFQKLNGDLVQEIVYLQHYAEGWDETMGFQIKYDERPCIDAQRRYAIENGIVHGRFFSAKSLKCLSIQGQSSTLADAVLSNYNKSLSIMVDRAETILHDHFGDIFYWKARRSMRYARHLRNIADQFRAKKLNSTYEADGMPPFPENWEIPLARLPKSSGGNYLAVHLRRGDFVRAHADDLPSISDAAKQISQLCKKHALSEVFLSTDASDEEVLLLRKHLSSIPIIQFEGKNVDENLSQGEISIIDQWICAHARFFVGTHVSTFSYRIQEDREILGFPAESTFNRLCPNPEDDEFPNCEQPAKWNIVYN